MAQIIQIRRGTGSATPSSLAEGELAINVDSGKLYYGQTSTSASSNFQVDTLTANNYVISSSVTSLITQTLSGSTQFGDSTDDTHQFTGNITASGNISASGTIIGSNVSGTNTGDQSLSHLAVTGSNVLFGNVTSTGNISASGDLGIEGDFTLGAQSGYGINDIALTIMGGETASINLRSLNTSWEIETGKNYLGGDLAFSAGGVESVRFEGNGNISASGKIYGTTYNSRDVQVISYASSLGYIQVGTSADSIPLVLHGNVTASGNISSSGEIKAATLDIASTSNFADDITIADLKKIIGSRLIISSSTNTSFYGTVGFNDTISSVTSTGTVTAADVFINGDLNSGTPILSFSSSVWPQGGIVYYDSGDTARYALFFPEPDVVSIANRAANGTVQIRANNSTAGGVGEVTSSIFTSFSNEFLLPVTASGNIRAAGTILAGWHGSTTRVKILPSDFIPDDVGRPAQIDDTGSDRWLESHATAKLFASIPIPTGFKATHVHIHGSATSAITVYEADINSKTVTSKGTGNIGTEIDITDVTSDTTNYIMIEMQQASGEEVYGGYVTIAIA